MPSAMTVLPLIAMSGHILLAAAAIGSLGEIDRPGTVVVVGHRGTLHLTGSCGKRPRNSRQRPVPGFGPADHAPPADADNAIGTPKHSQVGGTRSSLVGPVRRAPANRRLGTGFQRIRL